MLSGENKAVDNDGDRNTNATLALLNKKRWSQHAVVVRVQSRFMYCAAMFHPRSIFSVACLFLLVLMIEGSFADRVRA